MKGRKHEKRLAELLRQLRIERSLTQRECAEHLGLGHSTISAYENNLRQPPCDILLKLAQFYEVTTDYLLENPDIYDGFWGNLTYSQKQMVKDFASYIFERHFCEIEDRTKM